MVEMLPTRGHTRTVGQTARTVSTPRCDPLNSEEPRAGMRVDAHSVVGSAPQSPQVQARPSRYDAAQPPLP